MKRFLSCGVFFFLSGVFFFIADAKQVVLAEKGLAKHEVFVAENSDSVTLEAASFLAEYLGKITGSEFKISVGGGTNNIVVGTIQDFPNVPFKNKFKEGVLNTGDYVLQTHEKGFWVIGNTPTGVQNAVADFLYRLGYRHYFPHEIWEIIPKKNNLKIEMDVFGHPDFQSHFSSGSATDQAAFSVWRKHNPGMLGYRLDAGHVYQAIIRNNKKVFEEHPEFLALVDGKRQGTKFCTSNLELQKMIVDWACEQFKKNPDKRSISMDPSDGGGWCECEDCAKFGGESNQSMTLANQVAEAVNNLGLGEKYVGLLAYHRHCAPPDINMHPHVAVYVTTSMHTGGWNLESILKEWRKRNPNNLFGIFTYLNNVSTKSLPGKSLYHYAKEAVDTYHLGARMAVNGYSPGTGGVDLSIYMVARAYWDIKEAKRIPEIYAEFLDHCFGPAKSPMNTFFREVYVIDEEHAWEPLFSNKIGKMYRALAEASKLVVDEEQLRRVKDMILYTRYCELYLGLNEGNKVKSAADYYRFVYRIRERSVVNARQLFSYFPVAPRELFKGWHVPYNTNPWKNAQLPYPDEKQPEEAQEFTVEPDYSDVEIKQMLVDGIKNNPVQDIETKAYSKDYVPAFRLAGFPQERPKARRGLGYYWGPQTFYTWVEKAPAQIDL